MPGPLNDPTCALLRAIREAFADFAGFMLEDIRSRSWASVTFSGARHELTLRLEGAGAEAVADRFLAGLDCAEFALGGHIMADIALVWQERRPGQVRVGLEALTVEDR